MMTFTRRTATALGFAVLAAPASALAQSDADRRFAALAARFIDQSLALQPAFATQQGDHRFDDQIDDVSAAGLARQVALARTLLAEADALRPEQLSRENQVDLAVLKNQLRYGIWTDEVLQSWAWDPQIYSGIAGKGVPEGKKSLAIAVTLQPVERTLTDAEIEAVSSKIVAQVVKATGAVLRG